MMLRDVNAIGNRSIEPLCVRDVVDAVWHFVRYLESMPTSLISVDVSGGVLGIVGEWEMIGTSPLMEFSSYWCYFSEMDASDEEREGALTNLVVSVPRDDYVVLKAVIGHARRLVIVFIVNPDVSLHTTCLHPLSD